MDKCLCNIIFVDQINNSLQVCNIVLIDKNLNARGNLGIFQQLDSFANFIIRMLTPCVIIGIFFTTKQGELHFFNTQ